MGRMRLLAKSADSPAMRVMSQVETWPEIVRSRADCGVGRALAVSGRQIAHVHHGHAIELRLGRPAIVRMDAALASSGQVTIRPDDGAGRDWVTVSLHTPGDEAVALSLASAAIHAALVAEPPVTGDRSAGCSLAGRRPYRTSSLSLVGR
jgi:luciferase-like monooxygenase